ncbi:MAG: CsgG/HfaB family protein [Thermodesulfobacteriota bacterium]
MLRMKATILLACASVLLGITTIAHADFVAYSVSEDGAKRPLPKNIRNLEVKDILSVEWGKYSGNKTRIGVMQVENTSSSTTISVVGPGGTMTYNASGGGVPVQGIEAIITDVMHKTGRFRLVERKILDKTLQEQDLGASGRVAKPSSAKIGKILGAQYLFQAVITNYEAGVEKKGGGLGGILGGRAGAILGGLRVKSGKAVIGMNFRLIDSETTEVIYTDQVEVAIKESGLTFGGFGITGGGALGGFMSSYSKTPIGQAVIAAVNQGVFGLVKQVGASPATGTIMKVKNDKVYVNLGENTVSVGDKLTLMSMGEELIDPDTGISLGGDEEEIGTLEVVSTKKKYSIAKPLDIQGSEIERGQKVVSQRQPAPLEFGSTWASKKKKGLFRK